MDANISWASVPHQHCGLSEIANKSLNAALQIFFHAPHFLTFIENNQHSCSSQHCVLCQVKKIWNSVKNGFVDVGLSSELSDIINCQSGAFETTLTVLSFLHHDSLEANSDESPVLSIFGGKLNNCISCSSCASVKNEPELLLCLQVSTNGIDNIQAAINNAFLEKSSACKKCSNPAMQLRILQKHPKMLLIRPVSSCKNSKNGFIINETIHISLNSYRILGAIVNEKIAVVRCPNNNLVSFENRKVRSTSWNKFLEMKTGAESSLLIYQNITPAVASPEMPQHSTPVNDRTLDSQVQSTTKWTVTPIDQQQKSQSSGTKKVRRKLYDSPGSSHKFSRSSSKVIQTTSSGGTVTPSLNRGRFIYIRTIFSFKTCARKPIKFKFFTGLSVDNFRALYNLLGGDDRIKELKMKYDQKTPKKFSSKTILSSEDKLFMFLLRLRRGYPFEDLGYAFGIDADYCGRIVYSVLRYLCITFKSLEKHLFLSAEAQNLKKPLPFRPFKNLRVIIDGFEVFIDCPSNFQQQGNTYSDYKSHNTVRFILGISCYGGIIFVSPGYEGNMSEKKALAQSGFFDMLHEGDAVMSDRGFDITDELLKKGVELIKPPSLGKRSHFTPEEEMRTRAIASARIYVEHAVRLIKANRLLRSCIPLTLLPTISDYVYVAGYLANFGYKKMGKRSCRK